MSNFQTNTVLHPVPAPKEDTNAQEFEAKKVPTGTVFMGPLSHREETVDSILRAQASGAWSEEMEAQYMESVRNKATAKVRAMLLQAKRRSDEIITEAQIEAQRVIDQAHALQAQVMEQQAQIQGQFDEAYGLGTQKAMEDVQNILAQNQKALGESTAVVLLSIHQQLQKFYDVWREELRLLTLEAIKVGSGWIGDGKKEEILADMLDECVRKMVEKTSYTVRVHPSDGALVSQVLENSKEKDWRMETSNELEPGSLELEGTHALVKNQSGERKRFVQEILDELVLPKKPEEAQIVQNVTDTLMGEMNTNPLLAQNPQENHEVIENLEAIENETIPSHDIAFSEQYQENMQSNNPPLSEHDLSEQALSGQADFIDEEAHAQNPVSTHNPPLEHTQETAQNTIENQPIENKSIENKPEEIQAHQEAQAPQEITTAPELPADAPIAQAPQIDPNTEAQDLVDSFLTDDTANSKNMDNSKQINTTQASDSAQTQSNDNILPANIADDLLSEMGFGDDTNN